MDSVMENAMATFDEEIEKAKAKLNGAEANMDKAEAALQAAREAYDECALTGKGKVDELLARVTRSESKRDLRTMEYQYQFGWLAALEHMQFLLQMEFDAEEATKQ